MFLYFDFIVCYGVCFGIEGRGYCSVGIRGFELSFF